MMKKVFLFALSNLYLLGSYAQSDFKPEWNIGLGFGPTFSSMSLDYPGAEGKTKAEMKNITQMQGGLAVRYISDKNVGIIGELNYSQQGWKSDYKNKPTFTHSHSLTYIELPVMTHIYFGNKTRFFVNLGPKIQLLMDEKEKISSELVAELADPETQLSRMQYNKDAERKFDYGILGGMGVEFRSAIGYFMIEGRYYFGLGDIYSSKKSTENFSRSANRVLSAKLTYYVNLSK